MPKERLHILLAHQAYDLLKDLGAVDGAAPEAYLLGSIDPDLFFYDLPSFKLGKTAGAEIHKYQGQAIIDCLGSWAEEGGVDQPIQEMKHWMLGFASHLLADGLLHPHINGFCRRFSEELGFTNQSCHHWLESELESYWLQTIGPSDGYIPLLRKFAMQGGTALKHAEYVRRFLLHAGLVNAPSEAEIRRCSSWQTRLLRFFANPLWAGTKPILLKFPMTEPMGVLMVPPKSSLCNPSAKVMQPQFKIGLCEPDFVARTIFYLATHLLELLKRF